MRKQFYLSAVSALSLMAASTAFAQEAAPASGAVEEIVVTGSRIARRDFVSASPIVTQSVDAMKDTGKLSVEGALNQLPQFTPAQTERSNSQSGGGRATLNLRGLGQTRNLILMDGRRLPASDAFGVVDVNIIPQGILSGVETISGGASAVYGSDAISGVVNFKTLTHYNGVRVDAQYGDTEHGGGETSELTFTAGHDFADQRGNALISLGYANREDIPGWKRDYITAQGVGGSTLIGQGTYVPGANAPSQAAVNALFSKYGITSTVSRTTNFGFNDDGTLFNQTGAVNYKGPTTGYFTLNGGGVRQWIGYQTSFVVPQTRRSVFAKVYYDLTDDLRVYGQAIYVNSLVNNDFGWTVTAVQPAPTVPVTNPWIPADLKALLASRANPTADFTLSNKRFMSLDHRTWDENFDVSQVLIGASGKLPIKDWKWDVYASHDSTRLTETANNVVMVSHLEQLIDDPRGGETYCAGGFNPFGLAQSAQISAACKAYLTVNAVNTYNVSQDIFEGSITGALLTLPADDVRFSLSASHRENRSEYIPDALYVFNDGLGTAPSQKTTGKTAVSEIATEVLVPVLKDFTFAKSLNLSLGYRYSNYDAAGGVSTYKAEGDWKPIDSILVRGGYERAIRAPNIGELYSASNGSQGSVGLVPQLGDPCDVRTVLRTNAATAASVRTLCLATGTPTSVIDTYTLDAVSSIPVVSRGNPNLSPEQAVTKTLGVVWRPTFDSDLFSSLSVSIDYYNIKITDIIGTVTATNIINKCYNRDGSNPTYSPTSVYCTLITRAPDGTFQRVLSPYLNLGTLATDGFDFQVDWSFGLGAIGLDDKYGRVSLGSVINNTAHYKTQVFADSPVQDFAGTINGGSSPEWRALTTFGYTVGPVGINLRWRWIPKLDDVTTITNPAAVLPGTASYNVFDLGFRWKVGEKYELRGNIANLADRKPNWVSGQPGTTSAQFDTIGRAYTIGFRASF